MCNSDIGWYEYICMTVLLDCAVLCNVQIVINSNSNFLTLLRNPVQIRAVEELHIGSEHFNSSCLAVYPAPPPNFKHHFNKLLGVLRIVSSGYMYV